MQTINLIISALFQIILFSIIPFIWWFISGRKQKKFFEWLGLKKLIIKDKINYVITFISTLGVFFATSLLIVPFIIDKSTMATSQFSGQGVSALIPAFIYAFLQTGLSEELFFRGYLTKILMNKFGFNIGNIVQSSLFGLVHGLMFFSSAGYLGAIISTLLTGIVGWLMGYINEKQSNGSIVSSWLLHGCANTLAAVIAIFNIV